MPETTAESPHTSSRTSTHATMFQTGPEARKRWGGTAAPRRALSREHSRRWDHQSHGRGDGHHQKQTRLTHQDTAPRALLELPACESVQGTWVRILAPSPLPFSTDQRGSCSLRCAQATLLPQGLSFLFVVMTDLAMGLIKSEQMQEGWRHQFLSHGGQRGMS